MNLAKVQPYAQFLPVPATASLSLWLPVGAGPRERIYFETPDWYTNTCKVLRVRVDSTGHSDNITGVIAEQTTLTLVDVDSNIRVGDVPITRFAPDAFLRVPSRCQYLFEPFRLDSRKSYVQTWSGIITHAFSLMRLRNRATM